MNNVVVSSHRYRKKFYVVKVECIIEFNQVIFTKESSNLIDSYLCMFKKPIHVDRILYSNVTKNHLKIIGKSNIKNYMKRHLRFFTKTENKIRIYEDDDMFITPPPYDTVYLLFKSKDEYLKFKLRI